MIRKLLLLVKLLFTTIFTEKTFIPNVKLLCLGIFFVVSFANAATFYSRQSGNWNDRNTWSNFSGGPRVNNGVFPLAGDIVHIEGGDTVTLTTNAACASIDFAANSNNSLVLAGYTLNVSGNITIPRATTLNTLNVGAGNLTAGSIDFPTTGSAVRHKIIISTGTVTVSGSISTDSNTATSATIEFTGAGTLKVGGGFFSSGGGALTPSTGTVELNGANQSFNSFSYYNLTLSGSGTKTFSLTTATSVTNSLIINSGVNADLSTLTHSANRLTLGSTQALASSWGSTTSNATNKSDVYFTATTGKINVTTSTCSNFSIVTPITNVLFNTLNKTTAASSTVSYEDYTSETPTAVSKTQYYALTVKGNTGGDVNGYYSAFFDWNNDGDFDDADEYYRVGTIRNSSGTDSKVTSVYIQIPSTAVTGTIKMRVIGRVGGYNTTPCAISGSTGQMEDYKITIQDACTGSTVPGTTLSTANPVCASTPFTLSLQNQSAISKAATYVWETSIDGGTNWLSATPAPKNFFSSDFSSAPASTNVYGSASITGGELVLTAAVGSQQGGFVIQTTPGLNLNPFTVNFNYTASGGNGADGFSLSYASNINNDAGGGESGEGSGIVVQFDTYDNEGVATGSRVRVLYNNIQLFATAIDAPFNLLTSTKRNVNLNVDANGVLSLSIGGTVFIANLQLPSTYLSSDKSAWKFKFSGRTGLNYDKHAIDDLSIKYLDVANSASTFTTTQTVPTQYRAKVTCGGTTFTSIAITVNMVSAVVNPINASSCSGVAFTVTPANGTNGTIPAGTTYSWPIPVVTGGITGAAASIGSPTSITGTFTNTSSAAQTATYTVTPTASGCAGATFTVTVTVNPLPTPTFDVQPTGSTCIGTSVTYTTQGAMSNYIWGFPGTAGTDYTIVSGGTNADNTVTLRYLTSGSKIVSINYRNVPNSCTATSATSSSAITVNPLPTTPSIGTHTDVTCTTSGSVTLNNLPGGNWTINQTGFVSNTINNTGTSYKITGLAAGTYRFTVSNGTCTSAVSSDVIITNQSSTTWSGTGWSNSTPDASKAAIIAGAFTIASDLTACSLTINPGIAITVPSNYTLTVVNALTVSATASLTFENHSSLVQVNDNAVNSGNIKYKRIAAKIRRGDFVYWSTPVTPQKLIDVSPLTLGDKYFGYSGDNWVITNKNTVMKVGKGYIIRGPQTYSLTVKTDYPAEFNGVPNNGVILGETLTAGKPYLIGNPYPSALSAKKFLDQNIAVLEGTLYFWTHNTPVTLTGVSTYTSDDYASYNLTGSTVVKERAITGGTPGSNNEEPSGFIGAGQSFFAVSKAGGTVTFNNDMRLGAADNTQFFKSASKETTEAHRVWLNMTNTKGVFKQMLVGYVQGATNEYEDRYDGVSFNANPYVDFYSVDNANNYVIQGRALPFTETDQVPLGYSTTITGDFTISIDKADGDLSSHAVYIEDKKTGVIHDLTASDYTFTTEKGIFADRLVLRYTNKTLGTGDFENAQNGLLVSVKDKTIKVTSSAENIQEVTVFDISGKLLYSKKKAGTTELQIQNLQSANQVLLVKVTLDNDFTVTKKIIFN